MTDLSTQHPVKPDPGYLFTQMAERSELNKANGFAGAFVIYPPSGDPIAMLLVDDKADPALFLATVKSKIEMAIMELDDQQKAQQGMYGRR